MSGYNFRGSKENKSFKGTGYAWYIFCHVYKGDNFAQQVPSGKGSTLEGKNLLSVGASPFGVNAF